MMERLPRWFGNFTRLCCAQEIVLEVTFCKVSAFFIHFKMVLIIIQLLYKKRRKWNKSLKNDFFHYAFSCFGENSFIDKVEFFKNFVDISCVFCGWYLDWRVSLGIVRGVVSHEFSMKFPFYSTAKLLVILAHFSHRKLTNTTMMLIFFSWFFHVKCGKTSLSILVTLQNNLDHQRKFVNWYMKSGSTHLWIFTKKLVLLSAVISWKKWKQEYDGIRDKDAKRELFTFSLNGI